MSMEHPIVDEHQYLESASDQRNNTQPLCCTTDRVADTSNGVNSKLQKHRDTIEELNRVRTLLQKLQAVIDLPKRLKIAKDEQAYSTAVESYCSAAGILQKYGHQGVFRTVAAEAEAAIADVARQLEERLEDPEAESEACVKMLRKIGGKPDDLQVTQETPPPVPNPILLAETAKGTLASLQLCSHGLISHFHPIGYLQ